jgi:hypothetical protein
MDIFVVVVIDVVVVNVVVVHPSFMINFLNL